MQKMLSSLDELQAVRDYLNRIGAEVRSLKSAVIKRQVGAYQKDLATVKFADDGTVTAKGHEPTAAEQKAIHEAFKGVKFPELKLLPSLVHLPEELAGMEADDIFEFRDVNGNIIMLQGRFADKEGGKYYLPFTFWSDEKWRRAEPEGLLPLWGLEGIKDNTTVFIHEGAKAARAVRRMIEAQTFPDKEKLKAHPWGSELSHAAHLGWVGGALSPARTDWAILNKLGIKTAYIVSDNDQAGVSAVSAISCALRMPTFHLQFTNEWPASFDLADPFPEHMFKILEDKPRYVGPAFRSCIHPATWATDALPDPNDERGVIVVLREHFKDMWAYIEEADLFVCKAMPNIIRQEKILDNMLASFSHTSKTSKLIYKAYSGRTTGLAYRPDRPEQIITQDNSTAINLHIPTTIKSEPGDPKPFLEYIEYMFPVQRERKEVERWIATLIARPDLRMEYGLLLISESQGIGKTTLGSIILSPLINPNNVGWPRENDIVATDFNGWMANKRLVIVNEIYSGQSWKSYHTLKSVITDKDITVNEKFQRPYKIENWVHVFACSNSMQALKMEGDDRRWFYPTMNEERWPREKFGKLRDWLASGGLGIIKTWAERYGDYVSPGERAPMTAKKKEMIEGSRSEAQHEAAALAEAMMACDEPVALAMKDIVAGIRAHVQGRVFDSDYEIRKTMVSLGVAVWPGRVRIHGRLQYVILNQKMKNLALNAPDEKESSAVIIQHLKKPTELVETEL